MGVSGAVLVLNQNYEPLNVCNEKRAIVLVNRGKAEILEHGNGLIRTPSQTFARPSVIRLVYLIRRPRPKARLTRREVFLRDNFTCQYCGVRSKDLTIDHVIPRHRGGKHTWENLVSACRSCNHRKGGKTLEEAKMTLRRPPAPPRVSPYYVLNQYLQSYTEWKKFVPEWELGALVAAS
ncbi:MAG: HNH endonuclease [Chloroflexi bacterium]|jgi:5-methylcytosine-specific restriction endonuclease McrA|nr:HNH endonuclease [Chloroflexota bacterium]HLG50304.1 HNH endonuclease [Chloroflexota bacterium]